MHETLKPVGWFKLKPQVRKQFDEATLRRLGESLRGKQLQPVRAQRDGTVICGERRVRAAKLVGVEALDVVVVNQQRLTSLHRRVSTKSVLVQRYCGKVQLRPKVYRRIRGGR